MGVKLGRWLWGRIVGRLMVFESRVLRRVFGPKRDEVTREWRKLHSDKLNDLYSLLNILQVIKSRWMRWAGHVAHMGRGEVHTGFWWGNLRERDRLEDLGINERIILKLVFRKWTGGLKYIDLLQNRYKWLTLVNAAMNFRVPYNAGHFLTRL